jgi:hypothetical protein
VFFGSGLLFLAMYFTAMAVAGGLVADSATYSDDIVRFGRSVMLQTINLFGARMAGTFMISLGTMWLRTGLMPRWLAVLTYLSAGALLISVSHTLFLSLVFPGWVLLASVYHLVHPERGFVVDLEQAHR